jgi:hypothetical protein
MAEITYATLQTLLHDTDIEEETCEDIIDLAVDLLNLFGADISNMTGAAGSKTLSVESREKGAIMLSARAIYYGFYKGVDSANVGSATVSVSDIMGNATVMNTIKEAAGRLKEVEVSYG